MSTLFIGVAIMAKIDSDKWQGRGFLTVIITLNYLKFEMQIFLEDQDATFSSRCDFDPTISTIYFVNFFLNVCASIIFITLFTGFLLL
jgi:hypothetical protein